MLEKQNLSRFIHAASMVSLAVVLILIAFALTPTLPVSAAVTITVDRNDDPAVTTAGSGAAACTAASNDCSLRGAVLVANANPGSTINIPAGTYTLSIDGNSEHGFCGDATIGDLDIAGNNTTITGAGSAITIIEQTTAHDRVICVDQFLVHNFTFTMSGVTITGGKETWGVGGGGMTSGDLGDSVILNDVVFDHNSADKTSGGGSPVGGGVGHSGGSFSCTNCKFTNNTSVGSGGGLYLSANYTNCIHPCAGTYTITNSTFSSNTAGGNGGGLITTAGISYSVTNSTFTNNIAQDAAGGGGGIYNESGTLTANNNTFTGNQAAATANGNAFSSPDGGGADITANFNRILHTASASSTDVHAGSSSTNSITDNWWGCNGGPGATGCATVGGSGTNNSNPWIVLKTTVSPSTVNYGDATTLTTSFLQNSSGGTLTASQIAVLLGLPVTWTNAAHGALSNEIPRIQPVNISSASESGSTVTITTAIAHGYLPGETVTIAGVGVAGYNGTFTIASIPTSTSFTYTDPNTGLGSSSGGTAGVGTSGKATATFTAGSTSADCGNVGKAEAEVDSVQSGDTTATASITIDCPDLQTSKTNNVSGQTQLVNTGSPAANWTWTLTGSNTGPGQARYSGGQTIISDNLPNSNATYGTVTESNVSGVTGTISCSIDGSDNLTCTANGSVNINSSGSFIASFVATPTAVATYANPRGGGTCAIDPNNNIPETNDANNSCSNAVTVVAPDLTMVKSNNVSGATTLGNNWTWKLHVANSAANASATFLNGDTILTDNLDNSGNLAYGTPTAGNGTNITNIGNVSCSITSNTLTCSATGTVVVGTSGSFDVTFTATPSAIGTYTNPRSGGACAVDPNSVVPETNEANNNCNTDSVTVTAPDLTISKANNVGGTVIQGQGYNWTLTITNTGNAGAIFTPGATLVRDDLDNSGGLVYGTPTVQNVTNVTNSGSIQCAINGSQTLTCVANGSTVTVGATTGNFQVVVPVTTVQLGTYTNPRSASICRVDPNNTAVESNESNNDCTPNSVTVVRSADLQVSKSGPSTVTAGSEVTYTVTITNAGPTDAVNIVVDDTLPGATNYVTQSQTSGPSFTLSHGGNAIHDILSNMLPSSSAIFQFVTSVPASVADGTNLVNTATISSDTSDPVSTNNSSTITTTVQSSADLAITKTVAPAVIAGTNVVYTVTLTNNGPSDAQNVSLTDTLPVSTTFQSQTQTGGGSTFTLSNVGNAITDTISTLPTSASATFQFTTQFDANIPDNTTITNTATATSSTTDPTPNNNTSSAATLSHAGHIIAITKSHSGDFRQGDIGDTYTLTVTNIGTLPTDGSTVFVTDTLPSGLTATDIAGTNWTCTLGTLSCSRSDVLSAGAHYDPIIVTVDVANNAPASVTNTATVSGGGAVNTTSDVTQDQTNIIQVPDLTIIKSHSGNFRQGDVGDTYALTVHNAGPGPTDGTTVTVTDTLPSGLTATGMSGSGWNCTVGTLTCTSADVVASGVDFPSITLTVTVATNASASITNTATVAGGGELNTSNDSASNPTNITQVADLVIAKSHSGNFAQGQVGATYVITVTNSGTGATDGSTVTVNDTLPSGLTATNVSGTNWTCPGNAFPCTRSDVLGSGNSYEPLTLTVDVAPNASPVVTNTVTVSGGGEVVTNNDSANDVTNITQYPNLTITKTHSGTFLQSDTGRVYTITVTNSGFASTDGSTVTVTDTLPVSLTATAMSGSGWNCTVGTLDCTTNNVAGPGASYAPIVLTVNVAADAPSSVTNTATVAGGGEIYTADDSASDPTTINPRPDLTLAKMHSGNFRQGDSADTYAFTVHNAGAGPTDGSTVTVTDTLPSGLTATGLTGSGWNCTVGTLTCTSTDVVASGVNFPSITLTVTVAANASATVTNTATVAGGGELNTANDNASDPTNVTQVADLTVTKSHSGSFRQGDIGDTYVITVTNSGTGPSAGTVMVTDTLPSGLTATSITGTNWTTCVLGTLTCSRSDALASGSSYEPIVLTVDMAASASATVTNTVTVSGGGEVVTANDSANDPTNVTQIADLTITKTHRGDFRQGDIGDTYVITVTNAGTGPSTGTVTVTDTLPISLTATSITGTNWTTCVLGTLTCSRSDALASGSSYEPITLTVNVANTAPASVTNNASVSGGGEVVTSNDSASDPTTINPRPDLTLAKTHSRNFRQGDVGDTYSLTVHNAGAGPTDGATVTVTDTLPSGLTATGLTGSGWNCTVGTLTCTSTDVVASGVDFPSITLTVTVAANASATVTNTATVAGGGELNTSNNDASDPTNITQVADLVLAKTHSGNFVQGQVGPTYTITVTNSGTGPSTGGVTVTDTLPSGLTATSITGTNWTTCVLGTLTCTRSDALASGSSYEPIVLTVDVAASASATVTNTATVSGGGEVVTANDSASDPTNITQFANLTIAKTHSGNFVQGDTGKVYTITVTNNGHAATDHSTVTVTDTLPSGLSATGWSGSGWNCNLGTLDCTRSDVLGPGASYTPITLTVDVANNATSVTNTVTVAGGGEIITSDDTANDATTINPFQNITISGVKFNDVNGNGVLNGGEAGIANWTIQLIDPTNSNVISTTTTGVNGSYSFANLGLGSYRVREVQQSGWVQTTANPADVVAHSGVDVSGIDFGNFQEITISGEKFNDLNANGSIDGGDVGIDNWTVQLIDPSNSSVITTTTTSGGGNYSFANLGPGTYRVREVAQSGWVQTTANPADITTQSGTNVTGVNFGNVLPANLTITKTPNTTHPAKGGNLTYTLVVTDTGPNSATNVVVTDTTPAHTTFVSLTKPGSWACSDPGAGNTGLISCSKSSMANGETATFQLVVQVDASTPDNTTIANTAYVKSDTYRTNVLGKNSVTNVTIGTFFYYLPFIGRNITIGPDLIVQSISTPGNSDIQVVIQNIGNQPTGTGFWVDLYVNPSPVPTQANQTWPFVSTQGAVWGVTSSINPGATLTLNIGDSNYWPSSGPSPLSNMPATLPAGAKIYVQVDSADTATNYGAILETNETNNITGVQLPAMVTLPANHAPARQMPYKNLPNRE